MLRRMRRRMSDAVEGRGSTLLNCRVVM